MCVFDLFGDYREMRLILWIYTVCNEGNKVIFMLVFCFVFDIFISEMS